MRPAAPGFALLVLWSQAPQDLYGDNGRGEIVNDLAASSRVEETTLRDTQGNSRNLVCLW